MGGDGAGEREDLQQGVRRAGIVGRGVQDFDGGFAGVFQFQRMGRAGRRW